MSSRPRPAAAPSRPSPVPLAARSDDAPELPSGSPAGARPGTVEVGSETLSVPGIAALVRRTLGQNRSLARTASGAAIASGVALFVVAGVASASAGTGVAAAHRPVPQHRPAQAHTSVAVAAAEAAPLPAARKVLQRTPTHASKKASTNHGVISGLAANGIPAVALNAYRVAAARMGNVQPSCGIDWSLLAGIGREESDHGRFGGAVLHTDGVSTPAIIGPALDGKHWDFIPAPGNGLALDGDAKYAHALGPMQFIPSTWAGYGADANGDGKADIFNINDAALGAARYLCAAGGDLRTQAGQVRAVLTYNHNDEYLAQVLALAHAYKAGIPITGIPVGITKGSLPKVANTGYIPPANPGDPTAAGGSSTARKKPAKKSSSAHPSASSHPSSSSGSRTSGSPAPSGSHSSSSHSPAPSPSRSSSSPAPKPSPTSTCTPLDKLLHKCS